MLKSVAIVKIRIKEKSLIVKNNVKLMKQNKFK